MRKKSKRKKKACNCAEKIAMARTGDEGQSSIAEQIRIMKAAIAEQIRIASKSKDWSKVRIPFSYQRIGKEVSIEQIDAENAALKKRTAATKRRLKRLGLWD